MKYFKFNTALFLLLACLFFSSQAVAKNLAGKILFAKGEDALIMDATGKERQARRGLPIWEGDVISSGEYAVQFRFTDGGSMALEPRSIFKVDEYTFNGRNDGKEKAFFSMLKGGLRTITGYIGHGTNQAAYKMKTRIATIGIRGTEYILREQDGGILVWVGAGSVLVRNNAGEVMVLPKQSVLIIDKNSIPKKTRIQPRQAVKSSKLRNKKSKQKVASKKKAIKKLVLNPQSKPAKFNRGDRVACVQNDIQCIEKALSAVSLNVGTGRIIGTAILNAGKITTESNQYLSYAGSGIDLANGITPAVGIEQRALETATYDNSRSATILTGYLTLNGSERVTSGNNNFADFGSTNELAIGRWTEGVTGGSFRGSTLGFFGHDSFHYLVGNPTEVTSIQTTGVGLYNVMAHTSPTLNAATTPGNFTGSIALDFSTAKIALQFKPRISGVTYAIQTLGFDGTNIADSLENSSLVFANGRFSGVTGNNLTVSQDSASGICGANNQCSAAINGVIAGINSEEIGAVYQVAGENTNLRLSGSAIFKNNNEVGVETGTGGIQ